MTLLLCFTTLTARLLFLMLTSHILAFTETRPLFYIYDWPVINETRYGYTSLSNLADVYPPAGAPLDAKSAYDHSFRGYGGAGIHDTIACSINTFFTHHMATYQSHRGSDRFVDRSTHNMAILAVSDGLF